MPLPDSSLSPDALEKRLPSWALPLSVFVFAFALRLFHLDYNGFWTDEWTSLKTARLPWSQILMERAGRGHMPLFFWLLKGWRSVVGEGEYRLRLLPAFFSALSVAALYLFGRRAMTPRIALFAALLFCFHQRCLWSAHDLRMYSMVLSLGIFSFYLMWTIFSAGPSFLTATLLLLCHAAGLLTHPTYLAIIGAQGLYLILFWKKIPFAGRRIILGVLIAASLLASPFYRIMLTTQRPDFYGETKSVNFEGLGGGLTQSFFGERDYLWGSGFKYLAWPILIAILGLTLHRLRRADSDSDRRCIAFLLIWWISPFLIAVLASLIIGSLQGGTRYYVVASPAACLLASRVLLAPKCRRRRLTYASIYFLLVATIGGAYLFSRGEGL
ncbi:MAG: glycosyltransferase family 39 protein, partial [bacterium]